MKWSNSQATRSRNLAILKEMAGIIDKNSESQVGRYKTSLYFLTINHRNNINFKYSVKYFMSLYENVLGMRSWQDKERPRRCS